MHAPANLPALPTDTTRHDGWTNDRRRLFLESLAEGHPVESACAHVGMSKVSAYALRRRDPGFALAWSAATLRARDALADLLTSRAINGQTETVTRDDGTVITRHRYDNRLAIALLRRLDRLAGQPETSELGQPDEAAARGVAHDFDAFVDLVQDADVAPQAIEEFVEPRIRKLRKLCSASRVWNWEKEDRATDQSRLPVWFDDDEDAYVTDFPPPEGFDGKQDGLFGLPGYQRTLTDAEITAMARNDSGLFAEKRAEAQRRHVQWFGASSRTDAASAAVAVGAAGRQARERSMHAHA